MRKIKKKPRVWSGYTESQKGYHRRVVAELIVDGLLAELRKREKEEMDIKRTEDADVLV